MNDRVAEHRQRMAESGYKQIALQMPMATIQKLDKRCKSTGQSRAVVVDGLIKSGSASSAAATSNGRKSILSDNNKKRFERFKKLHDIMESDKGLTTTQREEMDKIALQICYSMADE